MPFMDDLPRAVVPSAELFEAVQPKLCSSIHAKETPHPYGIAVHIKHKETGIKHAQPMYFVSEYVAQARGRGVRAGWYLVVQPGTKFSLLLSRVIGGGAPVSEGTIHTAVQVFVDGVNVEGPGGQIIFPGVRDERRLYGFVKSYSDDEGTAEVRQFQFQRSEMSESSTVGIEDGPEETVNANCIQLRMYTGPLMRCTVPSTTKYDILSKKSCVSEKIALKKGLGISVARDGKVVRTRASQSLGHYVQFDGSLDAIINVYFRERFWLESRSIIDSDGNAWTPRKIAEVIHLVDEPSDVPDGKSSVPYKKPKRGLQGDAKSKAKRAKTEDAEYFGQRPY